MILLMVWKVLILCEVCGSRLGGRSLIRFVKSCKI